VAQGAQRTFHAGAADTQTLFEATTTGGRVTSVDPGDGARSASREDATAAAPCSLRLAPSAGGGTGEAPQATLRRASVSTPAHAEARMHVERDGEGVRVWIGLDGDEAAVAARAATLVLHLRRALQAEGHRLLALTCNGRRVDEAPSPSTTQEQTTWRSER
jgi:hypothetical protein